MSSCTWPFFLYRSARFSNADRTLMCFVIFIWPCRQTNWLFLYLSTRFITRVVSFCVLDLSVRLCALLSCEKGLFYPFFIVCASQITDCFPLTDWRLSVCPHCIPRRVASFNYPILDASWILSYSSLELSSVRTRHFTLWGTGPLSEFQYFTNLSKPSNHNSSTSFITRVILFCVLDLSAR